MNGVDNPEPTAEPLRLLVVEDEAELAEILVHNLRSRGLVPLLAGDGLSACRLASQERPDAILLDIMLPDLNGWELCRMLRSHPDPLMSRTPIVMLTALSSVGDRLRGLELGADAYFPKPYSMREVILTATRLAQRYREWLAQTAELNQLRSC